MKKYQRGGGTGTSRDVLSALRTIKNIQGHGAGMSDIKTQEVKGETTEKLNEEYAAYLEEIEDKKKKSKGLFKTLKFLDFIPGGKWIKSGIKAGITHKEAKKMKDILSKAGTMGKDWEKTFLSGKAVELSKPFEEAAEDIDPMASVVKSLFSDVVSGQGETFKDVADKGMGGTPWQDQFLGQFGFDEDTKFGDLFRPGQSEGAMDFFGKWGFGGTGTGLDAPFFQAGQDVTSGKSMYDTYITGEDDEEEMLAWLAGNK